MDADVVGAVANVTAPMPVTVEASARRELLSRPCSRQRPQIPKTIRKPSRPTQRSGIVRSPAAAAKEMAMMAANPLYCLAMMVTGRGWW